MNVKYREAFLHQDAAAEFHSAKSTLTYCINLLWKITHKFQITGYESSINHMLHFGKIWNIWSLNSIKWPNNNYGTNNIFIHFIIVEAWINVQRNQKYKSPQNKQVMLFPSIH